MGLPFTLAKICYGIWNLAVLPGNSCYVVRHLWYRAPNRGAVCGIRWLDTGLRVFGGFVLCVEELFKYLVCLVARSVELPPREEVADDSKIRPGL